jgi:acyl dehydratase
MEKGCPVTTAGELVGLVVDEVSFDVERGKIREFARSTFATDPVHTDHDAALAAGFPAEAATPTHVVVAGHYRDQQGFVDKLGLAIERVVVGSVRWDYERPLVAGDSLSGTRSVVDDRVRHGRSGDVRVVTMETEYRDASGAVVVRVREELVERGPQ